MNRLSELSVFFPAYNEEDTIGSVINNIKAVMDSRYDDYKIIVINDGSKDNT